MVTPDYFGCFADSESDRALPVRLDDNLSIQGCVYVLTLRTHNFMIEGNHILI